MLLTHYRRFAGGCGAFPHLLLHGAAHAPKYERLHALLEEHYAGNTVPKAPISTLQDNVVWKRGALLLVKVNPGKPGLTKLLREKVMNAADEVSVEQQHAVTYIIIINAHLLNYDQQSSFKRVMERQSQQARFIFISDSVYTFLPSLRSRCMLLPCDGYSQEEMRRVLETTCTRNLAKVGDETLNIILAASQHSLPKAKLLLKHTADNVEGGPQTLLSYEYLLQTAVKNVIQNPSADIYYEELDNCLAELNEMGISLRKMYRLVIDVCLKHCEKRWRHVMRVAAACDEAQLSRASINSFIREIA